MICVRYGALPQITEYPRLKRSNTGRVVLFSGPRTGTVVLEGNCVGSKLKLGDHFDNFDEGEYVPLPEEAFVKLSN